MEKIMRLHSVSSTVENGFVYLPEEADWLAEYLHELTTFPATKHDDQTDSTSQALDWVKIPPTYPVSEYNLLMALERGGPIYDWMIKEFDEDRQPVKCPECNNSSPTQYGRSCHCQRCGRQWELPNPFNPERRRFPCASFRMARFSIGTDFVASGSTVEPAKPIHRARSRRPRCSNSIANTKRTRTP
jgi:hypothetical protein